MLLFILALMPSGLDAQPRFRARPIPIAQATTGATMHDRTLYTWGAGLTRITLPEGTAQPLRSDSFEHAGCTADIDADGEIDLVLHSSNRMVWVRGPSFERLETIDTAADFSDCLAATIFGRRGVLVTHRGMQVRFYERPNLRSIERWPYREIYSFYTASHQAGLLMRDVDRDGRPDLISGNYWIRSPESFELPWRLFAINTYNETPQAANLRIASLPKGIVVSQPEMFPSKVSVFLKPADPTQLWTDQRLDSGLNINRAAALIAEDVDADGVTDLAVAESGGAKRVLLWRGLRNGSFQQAQVISQGIAFHSLFPGDVNRDARPDLLAVGPAKCVLFENVLSK